MMKETKVNTQTKKLNMNKSSIFKVVIIGILLLSLVPLVGGFISFSNDEIDLKNSFTQKIDERTAFYDKMYKVISQKSQIAVKNDQSFKENVNTIMAGRKDAEQVVFKWITESNPNANYETVSKIYQDLSRVVESERQGFFEQEKMIQDIVRQHSNLIEKFPGSFYNIFLGRDTLKYTPVKSSITEEVMQKGKDDNVKLDL